LRTAGVISASGEEDGDEEEGEDFSLAAAADDAAAEVAIDRGNCRGVGVGDREMFVVMPPW
jgi:hypothetical protein